MGLSEEERAEGLALLAEATEGPWERRMDAEEAAWQVIGSPAWPYPARAVTMQADADLIVWLRNHADALVADESERLRAENEALREALNKACPWCGVRIARADLLRGEHE